MLNNFLPNEYVKSIYEISISDLKERGIKAVITDLDNTLVEWDRPDATPELRDWFEEVKRQGISVTIVSNNNENRVKAFADPLGIPFIFEARKPLIRAFKRAMLEMKVSKDEVVVIGDQLLTDVLGGNRSGLHTILVVPVAQTDGAITKINRFIERRILSFMKRKGMLNWEE